MKKYLNFSPIIVTVVIGYILFAGIFVWGVVRYSKNIERLFRQSMSDSITLIQSLEVQKLPSSEKYQIVLSEDALQNIRVEQNHNFEHFMQQYYEVQSNWLNMWLTFLAIFLGLMAIFIPIICLKFYEKQEEKLENVTKQAVEETKQMKAVREDVQNYVEQNKREIEKQLNLMSKDVKEVKQLTYQSKINEFLTRAYVKLQNKEYDNVLTICDEILSMDDRNFLALTLKGLTYGLQKKYELSIKHMSQALMIQPDDNYALCARGVSYINLNQFDKAIVDFSKSLIQEPNDIDTLMKRGFAYLKTEQYDKAIKDYVKVVGLKPDTKYALYNLTEAYLFNRSLTNAIATIKKYALLKQPYMIEDDLSVWKRLVENSGAKKVLQREMLSIIDSLEIKTRYSLEIE